MPFYSYLDFNTSRKTKWEHPYDYDPFTIFKGEDSPTDSVYTDRLYQWDSNKFDILCESHFGNKSQYFDKRNPKDIQKFLCEFLECDVILCEIIEYCNPSTGFPTWRLNYRKVQNVTT